jgi:hypothetical protein
MALSITLSARNENILRYIVAQDGGAGTTVSIDISTIKTDLLFSGSPMDQALDAAIATVSASDLTQLMLGTGSIIAVPIAPPLHVATTILRQVDTAANSLAPGVTIGPPNTLDFTSANTTATSWIVQLVTDGPFI